MEGAGQPPLPDFFISRAGKHPADAAMAAKIDAILQDAGHKDRVELQDFDFKNRNFMERMDAALASGARIISILTPEYLASDYCAAEWMHVLGGDPLNTRGRLIVLRSAECEPAGLLRNIAYWDLVAVRDNDALLADMVKLAIMPDAERRRLPVQHEHWRRDPPTILHEEIRPTENFTGRESALLRIDGALWSQDQAAAITQPAAVTGLGGIGKSTLARQYGWEARAGYSGVWWLNAASSEGGGWADIERGLVTLGERYIRGISEVNDRTAAARHVLEMLGSPAFAKPWLLIFDNVDDPKLLRLWGPRGNVRTLITSRLDRWPGMSEVEIREWPLDDAVAYLLSEADRADLSELDTRAIADDLGCLPLALSHAAAYLRDNDFATAASYRSAIAEHMREAPPDAPYDKAVFATFTEQIAEAEKRGPGARALLSLAAFYAPNEIPVSIFSHAPEGYPEELAALTSNERQRQVALGQLRQLSLIETDRQKGTFSVHRLVQAAARDALGTAREAWAARAVAALLADFPKPGSDTLADIIRLSNHVTAIARHATIGAAVRALAYACGSSGDAVSHFAALAETDTLWRAANSVSNASLRRTPEMPDGSATSPCRTIGSATCFVLRAT